MTAPVASQIAELLHDHRNAPTLWLAGEAIRIIREHDAPEIRYIAAALADVPGGPGDLVTRVGRPG